MASEAKVLSKSNNTGWDSTGHSFIVCDGKNHYSCDDSYSKSASKFSSCDCQIAFVTSKDVVIGNDRFPLK